MTLILFIVILSILVFVHEFGHFFAARRSGVKVDEFGFGFPPRLIGLKRGDMIWSINLIPFGGFVRLRGENGDQRDDPASFAAAPLAKRLIILVAGVLMNYALAWVLWSVVLGVGLPVAKDSAPTNRFAQLQNLSVKAYVTEDSAATQAGLKSGDTLKTIEGRQFHSTEELIQYTTDHRFPNLTIAVERDQQVIPLTIVPKTIEGQVQPKYGFGIVEVATLRYPWYVAPWYGLESTVRLTGQTFQGFGQLVYRLVTTGQVSEDLSGPVGIAILTGQVSRLGFISILQFVALLSISLAVINFLPLPALDGGRAAFLLIEKLTHRPVSIRVEQAFHAAGFYLLLLLIVLISIRDVQRFNVFDRIGNLFGS